MLKRQMLTSVGEAAAEVHYRSKLGIETKLNAVLEQDHQGCAKRFWDEHLVSFGQNAPDDQTLHDYGENLVEIMVFSELNHVLEAQLEEDTNEVFQGGANAGVFDAAFTARLSNLEQKEKDDHKMPGIPDLYSWIKDHWQALHHNIQVDIEPSPVVSEFLPQVESE